MGQARLTRLRHILRLSARPSAGVAGAGPARLRSSGGCNVCAIFEKRPVDSAAREYVFVSGTTAGHLEKEARAISGDGLVPVAIGVPWLGATSRSRGFDRERPSGRGARGTGARDREEAEWAARARIAPLEQEAAAHDRACRIRAYVPVRTSARAASNAQARRTHPAGVPRCLGRGAGKLLAKKVNKR